MVDVEKLSVWTATNGKNWIAATSTAPYFCFESDSEAAVLDLARDALAFYQKASEKNEKSNRGRERAVNYSAFKKISAHELTAA